MKIDISKTEKKTFFGGTQYVVTAKVELTPEEQAIHKKHTRNLSLFDNIESRVGNKAWNTILRSNAAFAHNYLDSGMATKFDELAAAGNFENVLLEGFKKWKRQIESHQSAAQNLGKSTSLEL